MTEVLLLIRGSDDLALACQDAGKFLAFRRRGAGRDSPGDRVLGIWHHPSLRLGAPSTLPLRLSGGGTLKTALTKSVGVSGIWELAWIEPLEGGPADWSARLSPDAMPDALISPPRRADEMRSSGSYAPVFPLGTPKAEIKDELARLHARHPWRIARPAFHDPVTGRLSPEGG